jgi:hypothetical protein
VPCLLLRETLLCREHFFSVFSVAKKRLNTEAAEILRLLGVEALDAQRTRRSSPWLPPTDALRHQQGPFSLHMVPLGFAVRWR